MVAGAAECAPNKWANFAPRRTFAIPTKTSSVISELPSIDESESAQPEKGPLVCSEEWSTRVGRPSRVAASTSVPVWMGPSVASLFAPWTCDFLVLTAPCQDESKCQESAVKNGCATHLTNTPSWAPFCLLTERRRPMAQICH